MFFSFVGNTGRLCEGAAHKVEGLTPPPAQWDMKFYVDADKSINLVQAGLLTEDQANQLIWDEGCKEQDTIGVVTHKRMKVCDDCTMTIVSGHAGYHGATLAMTTATLSFSAFLLMSERKTEQAKILSPVPSNIQDKDVLPLLKRENMYNIKFKAI